MGVFSRLSIRRRLALASGAMIAVTLTLAGLGLVVIFERYLERRVGQELTDRLLEVAGSFSLDDGGQPELSRAPVDARYNQPYGGVYWYVRTGEAMQLRSRSLWDATITRGVPGIATKPVDAIGPGGSEVYLLERAVALGQTGEAKQFILGVAIDHGELKALSSSFSGEVGLGLLLIGLTLFAGAWLQTGYGLRPLSALREQLGALHAGARERLEGPFPDEVAGLTSDLNTLFDRQQDLLKRARERAGTLAHGLKTPLTILSAEATRLEKTGHSQPAAVLREQIATIRRQVDRELARARAHGATAGLGTHADLLPSLMRLVDLMKRMPRGDLISWRIKAAEATRIAMDPDDLGEVLGNLLDNARKWASHAVEISAVPAEHSKITITVSDDGPGIPESYRQQAVTRGESQAASEDDSGLGLAIVNDLLAPYGAAIRLEASALGGAAVSFDVGGR